MRDRPGADRLQRYLRVAYDGGGDMPVLSGEAHPADGLAAPRRRRTVGVQTGVVARVAALVLAVLLVGIGAIAWVQLRSPAPPAPAAPVATPLALPPVSGGSAGTGASAAQASTGESDQASAGPAVVVVHVAGQVQRPGVVEMATGMRVDDAIAAAGGPTEEANLDALNLAAAVVDGAQVYVPAQGEIQPGGHGSGRPGADGGLGTSGPGPAGAGAPTLVNLNTADLTALDTLPGVGPAIAARILDWRTEHGPFTSVDQLTDVSGIGPARMAELRDLVTI